MVEGWSGGGGEAVPFCLFVLYGIRKKYGRGGRLRAIKSQLFCVMFAFLFFCCCCCGNSKSSCGELRVIRFGKKGLIRQFALGPPNKKSPGKGKTHCIWSQDYWGKRKNEMKNQIKNLQPKKKATTQNKHLRPT